MTFLMTSSRSHEDVSRRQANDISMHQNRPLHQNRPRTINILFCSLPKHLQVKLTA